MPRTLSVSATLLALAAACAAEDAPVIIVTAERGESDLARTPQSVEVVNRSDLDQRGNPLETVDWFKEISGVDVISTYGGIDGGVPQIRIRGLDSQYTEVLIDGIPTGNPTAIRGDMNFAFLSPAGIDSLELVKGPQSGLYGSRAVGGVANLLTIRPTGKAEERVDMTAGSFNTYAVSGQATGPLKDGLGYAVAVEGMHSSGFSATTPDPNGDPRGYEADGVERGSYDLRLEWHPRAGGEIHVGAMGSRVRQDLDDLYYQPVTYAIIADTTANDTVARNEVVTDRVLFGGSSDFGALHLQADAAETSICQHNQTINGANYFSGTVPDPTTVNYRGRETFATAQAAWRHERSLRISVGADGQWQEGSQDRSDLGGLWSDAQRDLGAWTQLNLSGRNYEASAVGRHDEVSGFGGFNSGRIAGALLTSDGNWKLRGSVGNGFRAPTLYERYGVEYGSFQYQGNPDLAVERFLGVEGGVDARLDRHLEANATVFRTRFSDRIDYLPNAYPSTQYNDPGTSYLQGIETGLKASNIADSGVDLDLDYTHLRTADSLGDPISYNPTHRGGARVTAHQGISGRWSIWQSVRVDRTLGYFSYPKEQGYVDGYTLVSAVVGVKLDERWEASVRVENLTDERYTTSAATGYAYATMPRSYFLNLSGSF